MYKNNATDSLHVFTISITQIAIYFLKPNRSGTIDQGNKV